jgi:teichuronic acid exporter
MSLTDKLISSAAWSYISLFGRQAINFILQVLLARLLLPSDFGLITMIESGTTLALVLADFGLSASIVQSKDLKEENVQTVFWLNIALAGLISGAFAVGAPALAAFYRNDALVPLARVMGLVFIIDALGMPANTLLRRDMDFKKLAVLDIATMVVSSGIALVLAYNGAGVWALAFQRVGKSVMYSALMLGTGKFRPRFVFDWHGSSQMVRFSLAQTAHQLLYFFSRNADAMLIGRFLGASPLGIYQRSLSMMQLPQSHVLQGIGRVMTPALSAAHADKAAARNVYLRTIRLVSFLTMPLMAGLFAVTDVFVLTLFGEKWREVIPVLQVLCPVGAFQILHGTTGWLYVSQGRADLQLKWTLVNAPILIGALAAGVYFGGTPLAVATAYLIVQLLFFYPDVTLATRLLDIKFTEAVGELAGSTLAALLMMGGVYGVRHFIPDGTKPGVALTGLVIAGGVFYVLFAALLRLSAFQDTLKLVQRFTRRKAKPA